MKKTIKTYFLLLVISMSIFYCKSNLAPTTNSLTSGNSLTTSNSNANNQFLPFNSVFQNNPFNFNPFQGFNLNQPSINPLQQTQNQNFSQTQQTSNNSSQSSLNNSNNVDTLNNQLSQQQTTFNTNQEQSISISQQGLNPSNLQQNQPLFNPQQNLLNNGGINQLNNGGINQNIQNNQNNQQSNVGPFKFSSALKDFDVSLISPTRVKADLTGSQKFFMMDEPLRNQCKRGCTSQFRIVQNSGWMALGVCDRRVVLSNNLKWKKQKTGHGTYLLGSFGGSWSNLHQSENDVMKSFKFTTNDTIRITYNPAAQKIIFDKKGSSQTFSLQYDWREQDHHLCGLLYYANDQVEYLGTTLKENLIHKDGRNPDSFYDQLAFQNEIKNSKLRLSREQARNLQRFFDKRIRSVKLLYRASENGFSASEFHRRCDNRPHTLTLIETSHGKRIGGYTALSWDSSGSYGADNQNKGFLFSITNNQKLSIKLKQYAIYKNSGYGPTFGGGHDVHVSNQANSNSNSYCNLGHSYNYAYSGSQAYNRFCGGYNFSTRQYQVYEISFEQYNSRDFYDDPYYNNQNGFRNLRDSKIRLSNDELNSLRNFLDQRVRQVRLLYRGSENSFLATAFHQKCDNQINTLTIIQSSNGKKFGGYTPLAWDSSSSYGVDSSNKSFIFSLSNNEKLTLKIPQYTIYKASSYGPTFGGGHDIYISSGGTGTCNIPHSYNYSGSDANNRICGSSQFTSKQYEVYQVIYS